jgi:hypothetical protein
MAYLPKAKLLVEADLYTLAPPNTARPAQPNPASVNLYDKALPSPPSAVGLNRSSRHRRRS